MTNWPSRLANNIAGKASAARLAKFEWYSCARKIRHDAEPPKQDGMSSYPCQFCGGWHMTRKRRT